MPKGRGHPRRGAARRDSAPCARPPLRRPVPTCWPPSAAAPRDSALAPAAAAGGRAQDIPAPPSRPQGSPGPRGVRLPGAEGREHKGREGRAGAGDAPPRAGGAAARCRRARGGAAAHMALTWRPPAPGTRDHPAAPSPRGPPPGTAGARQPPGAAESPGHGAAGQELPENPPGEPQPRGPVGFDSPPGGPTRSFACRNELPAVSPLSRLPRSPPRPVCLPRSPPRAPARRAPATSLSGAAAAPHREQPAQPGIVGVRTRHPCWDKAIFTFATHPVPLNNKEMRQTSCKGKARQKMLEIQLLLTKIFVFHYSVENRTLFLLPLEHLPAF